MNYRVALVAHITALAMLLQGCDDPCDPFEMERCVVESAGAASCGDMKRQLECYRSCCQHEVMKGSSHASSVQHITAALTAKIQEGGYCSAVDPCAASSPKKDDAL
eukprot:TRINITY_DN32315_c0_g1_i1.p1 TRINITY_DN32315_c0_g1~~TRINITY_DN32315_c0_g1_i1.p1  ORF type:complete len:106 (+),score=10.19 TRINITY_DN32315_c0_g1_i1:118-435(+)